MSSSSIDTINDVAGKVGELASKANQLKRHAQALGLADLLEQLIHMPKFWVAAAMVLIVALIIYWRIRDHS